MRRLMYACMVGIIVIAVAVFSVPASAFNIRDTFGGLSSQSIRSTSQDNEDQSHPCLQLSNHEYEVCAAYVANSSTAVLVPYYKYARANDNVSLQRFVTYRLGSRYDAQAYATMKTRVASWPAGKHDVNVPHIKILSVHADLQANTATLITQETWTVTDKNDAVIYQETDQQHTVTMRRVPSHVLHKWIVTSIN